MAKEKMVEVTDPKEAFEILGVDPGTVVAPDGSGIEMPLDDDQVEEPKKAPPEAVTTEGSEVEVEEQVENEVPAEKQTEEQRRTWQSERDKAIQQAEAVKQQNELLKMQIQAMQGVVAPLIQKYGDGNVAPQQVVEDNSEPEPDYIDEDGYVDMKKFATYQKKRDNWLRKTITNEAVNSYKAVNERDVAAKQIADIVKDFPEYIHPLTGKPDTERLEQDIINYTSNKSLVDIVKEMKGISASKPTASIDASLKAIERNADKPSTVVNSSESSVPATTAEQKKMQEALNKHGIDMYDLPPDFAGIG